MLNFINEVDDSNKKKIICIMGDPKSGKTTFINSVSRYYQKPGVYVEVGQDNGAGVLDTNINKLLGAVRNKPNMSIGIQLVQILSEIAKNIHEYQQFGFLVLDPLSNLDEEEQYNTKKTKNQLNFEDRGDINYICSLVQELIMKISESMDVFLIFHTKEMSIKDSLTGESSNKIIPNMTKNNGLKFTRIADAILYTMCYEENGQIQYKVLAGGNPLIPTGIRTNKQIVIPSFPLPADYGYIYNLAWNKNFNPQQ